jgi:hypothetical protein
VNFDALFFILEIYNHLSLVQAEQSVRLFVNLDGTEPGEGHYQFHNGRWASSVAAVKITTAMPEFCVSCTVLIAVKAEGEGQYSIVATSHGVISLRLGKPQGGQVTIGNYEYFSYYNPDPFAVLSFIVTVDSEDVDLYAVIYNDTNESSLTLPTRQSYIWDSNRYGADSLTIDYTDKHFCYNCYYIVGVYGFGYIYNGNISHSAFTITASGGTDSIIRLLPDRPQRMNIDKPGNIRYFSSALTGSLDDMTFTISYLDSGKATLYAKAYNSSFFALNYQHGNVSQRLHLPDPSKPTSYEVTNAGSEDGFVTVKGPHPPNTIFILAVVSQSPLHFSVTARASEQPLLLHVSTYVSAVAMKSSFVSCQ